MKNRSKRIEKLEAEIVRRGGVFGGGEGMDPDLLEDEGIYLRYYADDVTRAEWQRDSPETPIPPKEKPPYDRDRLMPVPRRDREMAVAAGGN